MTDVPLYRSGSPPPAVFDGDVSPRPHAARVNGSATPTTGHPAWHGITDPGRVLG